MVAFGLFPDRIGGCLVERDAVGFDVLVHGTRREIAHGYDDRESTWLQVRRV